MCKFIKEVSFAFSGLSFIYELVVVLIVPILVLEVYMHIVCYDRCVFSISTVSSSLLCMLKFC